MRNLCIHNHPFAHHYSTGGVWADSFCEGPMPTSRHAEGYGEVTFIRTDGRIKVMDNVHVDSIGIDAGTHGRGVVTVTQEDGTITHLPFIESWTVEYRI